MISNFKSEKENKEYLRSIIGIRGKLIDWKNSTGKEIGCRYDGFGEHFEGGLKIREYDPKTQKVYFEGYEKGVRTANLTKCELGNMLGYRALGFKYEIGDTINCLTIIDREYREDKRGNARKYYKYKCKKCDNEDWILEGNLKKERGCNACCPSPQKVVLGINTIWDKARWMIDFGMSIEDAKTHTPNSTKEVYVVCPDCKRIKKITPHNIYQNHSICCSCGDGVSYPEKLMESTLIQLDIKYVRQYKTNWSQNKRYDFYLPGYNTIIEVHGRQHYEYTGRGYTLEEEKENDKFKEELALNNGIKHYIIIDCRESILQHIKSNILDSELNELFDLSNINWEQCEEYALKNKVKEVCDYYKPGISTSDLAKEFGISKSTIRIYLNKGTELGWCKYDGEEEMRHGRELSGERTCKPVSQFTLDGEFRKTYPSIKAAERQTNIRHIGECCNGKRKTAGGYIWKYLQ